MRSHPERGSGLLLAMIVVLVITLVAVGVIRFSARELAGAYAGRQQEALVACAEAGRQLLLSKFRYAGLSPATITPINVDLSGAYGGGTRVVGGHVDQVSVTQVQVLPTGTFGPDSNSIQERSNTIRVYRFGTGNPYKVIVHCQDHGDSTPTSGRQLEVEYGLRFGL